jgi:hypothetical protein
MNGLAPLYHVVGATGPEPHYALNWGALLVTVLSNFLVVALIWVLENEKLLRHTSTKLVLYDRIDLIKPERREELKADLEARLGLKVVSVRVGAVDFLRDMTVLRVYYEGNDSGDVKNMLKIKNSDYASV